MSRHYRLFSILNPESSDDFSSFGSFTFGLTRPARRKLWIVECSEDQECTEAELTPTTKNSDGSWNTSVPGLVWRPFTLAMFDTEETEGGEGE